MRVVVNATPLIALSLVNRLDLLHRLFDEVLVPAAVYEEISAKDDSWLGVPALRSAEWIKVVSVKATTTIEPLLLGLDAGELQVLLLAREAEPDWVLIDERLARRVAKAMGLPLKGTVGILLAAFHVDLLNGTEAVEIIHRLVADGIRISAKVVEWFKREVDLS